jgi:Ca-activated chloride channel family protein
VGEPLTEQNGVNAGLPTAELEAPDADMLGQAQGYWTTARRPVDVVVVVDTSGSMAAEGRIEGLREGLNSFIDFLGPRDRIQIITFSGTAQTVLPMSSVGEKRAEAKQIADGLTPNGPTVLYDSALLAYNEIKANGTTSNSRAIVLLTDGRDERLLNNGQVAPGSQATLDDALAGIQSGSEGGAGVKLFTIGYGAGADNAVLQRLAGASSGQHFVAGPETIRQVYETVALFL